MLSTVLLAAICVGLAVIAHIQQTHQAWVRRELHKKQMAHERVAKKLEKLDRRVPKAEAPIPLVRPALTWGDDDYETRSMDAGETFLPVDFRHDLW